MYFYTRAAVFLLLHGICKSLADMQEKKFVITSVNCAIERDGGSSILISSHEYSKKLDGLNILVFDTKSFKVVKSESFTHTKRQYSRFVKNIPSGSLVIMTSQLLCSKKSSTDLKIQKSILYGLSRLGLNTRNMAPIDLRSSVYIFCNGHNCLHNTSSSIKLPYGSIQNFNEDPIMMSFSLYKHQSKVESLDNEDSKGSNEIALYIVIIFSSIFIFVSLIIISLFLLRRRMLRAKQADSALSHSSEYNSHEEKCNQRADNNNGLFQQRKPECKRDEAKKSFATEVEIRNGDHIMLYKVPSGVPRYNPPASPTLLDQNPVMTPATSEDYIFPNEYSNPAKNKTDMFEDTTTTTSFLDETLNNFAEYTSLEPYLNEEYAVPATTDNQRSSIE